MEEAFSYLLDQRSTPFPALYKGDLWACSDPRLSQVYFSLWHILPPGELYIYQSFFFFLII